MVYYTRTIIYIYPSRQSPDFRCAKMRSGVFWRLTVDYRQLIPPILDEALVGRRFLCRNNQVKSFVERSSFFHDFLIGKASGDDRQTVGRFWKKATIWNRSNLACSSGVNVELYFDMVKGEKRSNEILITCIKVKKPNFFYRKTAVLSVKFSLQWLRL